MSEKEEKKKAEPWQEIQKTLAEMKEDIGEVYSRLTTVEQKTLRQKGEGEGAKAELCKGCGVYVGDLYTHLKNDPERHGLVKEVVKEVPQPEKTITISEFLDKHDVIDCKDCRPKVDDFLKKKGLKIVKAEGEGEGWGLEL